MKKRRGNLKEKREIFLRDAISMNSRLLFQKNEDIKYYSTSEYTIHFLKIYPSYFHQIYMGDKKFECRVDDRKFACNDVEKYAIGHYLLLRETDSETGYTGNFIIVRIDYLTTFIPGWYVLQFPKVVCAQVSGVLEGLL
jgi:hypothetical protein